MIKYNYLYLILLLIYSCGNSKKSQNYSALYEEDKLRADNEIVEEIEEEESKTIIYKDQNFNPNIKTVLLNPVGLELGEALLQFGSNQELLLSFDELGTTPSSYIYTLVHCNADWTPSDLFSSEYLEGFDNEPIIDYKSSFNTVQDYIHYQAKIPTKNMKPILSGNYAVVVFEVGEMETPILTKRMKILDQRVNIKGTVKRATILDQRNYQHEVDFTVNHSGYKINDVFSDVKVVITQNFRWDNAITELDPVFINNDQLIYDHEDLNLFDGGNEYRFFDFKSLRYITERIKNIDYINDTNIINLQIDYARPFQTYSSYQDINGRKLIRVQEGKDPSNEADYALVHFTLPFDHDITHGKLYVFGQISDYGFPDTHEMIYNYEKGVFETDIYLKQGYYNYEYVLLKNDGESINRFIEGTHYETINDYHIYFYHRNSGEDFDQLIGIQNLSSKGLF